MLSGRRPDGWTLALLAVWVGGMVFMNSWDAVFIPFLIGAEALRRLVRNGTGRLTGQDWLGVLGFGLALGALTLLFYLPWLISFTSQAGGFYFNIIWSTAPQQVLLQFGGFFALLVPFLLVEMVRGWRQVNWLALLLTYLVLFLLIIVAVPLGGAAIYQGLCGDGNLAPRILEDGSQAPPPALQVSACRAQEITFGQVNPNQDQEFWRDCCGAAPKPRPGRGRCCLPWFSSLFVYLGAPGAPHPTCSTIARRPPWLCSSWQRA
ncbi:MAG: hypothetical protein HC915_11665 [Anaerolineae bacterium]|nr:hypothetical protein [Anaerolineae bacterium]